MNEEKKKYLKLKQLDGNTDLIIEPEKILEWLPDDGDSVEVSIVEMTKEEVEKLSEF
jgi:hypothetical protein